MQFMPHVQGAKYILLQYDFKKDKLICNNQIYDAAQMLHFSYVIDASPLAGSIPNYPFKNTLVASAASSGKFNVLPEKLKYLSTGKTSTGIMTGGSQSARGHATGELQTRP